tara:strand:- start:831 stop:3539 length:2709 start_codon:yes stop_codon:yes gene_type:complete
MVNKQTKLYENTVVKKNLNVSEKLDVLGTLKLPNLSNTRELIIKENCHIYKSLDITRTVAWNEDFYPILNIDTNNENSVIVNNINTFFHSNLNDVYTDIVNLYLPKVIPNKVYNIKNNVTLSNIINIENSDKPFICKNLNIQHNFNTVNLTVPYAITNNININNLYQSGDFLSNSNINISENTTIYGHTLIENNINVNKSLNYNSYIHFNTNSSFVLPSFNKTKTDIINSFNPINYNVTGSLRNNTDQNTVEAYINDDWYSISSIANPTYSTKIIIGENNNNNPIYFIQNNNIVIHSNTITNSFHLNKNTTNINEDFTVSKSVITHSNINIKNSLHLNEDNYLYGHLILPTYTDNYGQQGMIRYNNKYKFVELYNNKWNRILFNTNTSGIHINSTNSTNIFIKNKNSVIIDSKQTTIDSNVNIYSNLNLSNDLVVSNNLNINNMILFDKNIKINYNNTGLYAYVSKSHNTTDFDWININYSINTPYISNTYLSKILYTTTTYSNYSKLYINNTITDNAVIQSSNKFIYFSSGSTDIIINKMKFTIMLKKDDTSTYHSYELDLPTISTYFNLQIFNINNIILYDSSYNTTLFTIPKNTLFYINIKPIHTDFSTFFIHIFLQLVGIYHNEIYLNKSNSNFIYNIDNTFTNIVAYSDLNVYNNITFSNNINTNTLKTKQLSIDCLEDINTNILQINNDTNNPCFIISNNNTIALNSKIDSNHNINLYNPYYNTTLDIEGDTYIGLNTNIYGVTNIKNIEINGKTDFHKNVNSDNITINNNLDIFQTNINIQNNLYTNILNSNISYINKTILNKFKVKDTLYTVEELIDNDSIITNTNNTLKIINFLIDINGNIGINTDTNFNKFTIGEQINPNLSISSNGYTIMNCDNFYLNNINVLQELSILNT